MTNPPSWLKEHSLGSLLSLYACPGASRSEISGQHDGRLKIKIKALAKEGEANEELVRFLSEILKVSKSKVHLKSGESSRQKQFLIELPPEEILKLF